MKKTVCILLFIVIAGIGAAAAVPVDFGIDIENATGLTRDGTVTFTQKDTGSLWFSAEPGKVLKFALQGTYTFDITRYYLFELDLAKIQANFVSLGKTPFIVSLEGGRFFFSDFTGKVLAHKLDGIRTKFGLPFMQTTVSVGYGGLTGKVGSEIVMSKADLADNSDDNVFFAPSRLVEVVTLNFPELFFRQLLTFSAVLQQDLRPETDLVQVGHATFSTENGGRVATEYFGLGLSGPIGGGVYYNMYGYLGTGRTLSYIDGSYSQASILSYLVGAEVTLFLPKALQSRLSLSFLYTSGDSDSTSFVESNTSGNSLQFIPISRPSFAAAFSPQLGNIFYGEVTYSYKPLSYLENAFGKNFQIKVKGIPMFRSTPAPISETGLNPSSTALYLGTEVDGVVNFRILSDLGLSLTAGFFMPNTWAFTDSSVRALAKMELSISL